MKKIFLLLLAAISLVSCKTMEEVPFEEMKNYFFRNDAKIPEDVRIDSKEMFESLFGTAAFMGKGGEPTPVDFSSEIVLAVVNPVTDVATELKPVSLVKEGKCLVLSCKKITGDKQSWSMQPVLLVKVDRSYDPGAAKVKIE